MKKIILLSICFWIFCDTPQAQIVESVVSHPKIADGIYVDVKGNVYTTPGGLVNGTHIGRYDIKNDSYNPRFAPGFSGPINVTFYQDSLMVVTNFDNSSVYAYNFDTKKNQVLATGLDGPAGIAIDKSDNLYISNWGQAPSWAGHQIHRIQPSGDVEVFADSPELYRPQAIIVNHKDQVIVHSRQKLYSIDPVSGDLKLWVDVGHQIGNMTFRQKDSCIYGASNQGHKIIKIDSQGDVKVFAGSVRGLQDGTLEEARFNSPLGIAFTKSEDTLYIAEGGGSGRLRRIILNSPVNTFSIKPSEIEISPNPSRGVFSIHRQDETPVKVEILDDIGHTVLVIKSSLRQIDLNMEGYSSGTYIIRVSNKDSMISRRVIKLE